MKKLFSGLLVLLMVFSMVSTASAATIYWPTSSKRITSDYGWRTHPITGVQTFHYGIDIGAMTAGVAGDPVRAMHNGVVKSAGYHSSYGNVVFINHVGANQMHYSNVQSVYAHLHSISTGIVAGKAVNGWTQIGTMGTTGSSTGVHLHFETRGCSTSACDTKQTDAHNPNIWYSGAEPMKLAPINEELSKDVQSSENDDLSIDSPNYYSFEELAKMTPEELIEIGYPNPYEDFSKYIE